MRYSRASRPATRPDWPTVDALGRQGLSGGDSQATHDLYHRIARGPAGVLQPALSPAYIQCGRYWDRTSDLFGVNEALSR